jgi:hypothetical protein
MVKLPLVPALTYTPPAPQSVLVVVPLISPPYMIKLLLLFTYTPLPLLLPVPVFPLMVPPYMIKLPPPLCTYTPPPLAATEVLFPLMVPLFMVNVQPLFTYTPPATVDEIALVMVAPSRIKPPVRTCTIGAVQVPLPSSLRGLLLESPRIKVPPFTTNREEPVVIRVMVQLPW